ncbi:MAG TPA: Cof-type HAD-IIB family hydrolase [Candidatus Eisenbergiella merdipullorum]|uniref:Cof-type HAD-IIB family hydrolase n=1 Tax=Candidatus Eisenbergiella merdipullorum TaxID=2838553 RepID=A0A9D2I3X8_9FIRM|nr:Cof-type HAD-IIB family hydrolase [Candidatus Eisenbergiella merdipullorum]
MPRSNERFERMESGKDRKGRNEMGQAKYRLIALDMDGTLLNSGQRITHRAKRAMQEILAEGRHVVFATGRCRPQLEEYLECFPAMRYLICENGACVCDLKTGEDLFRRPVMPEDVVRIMDAAKREDVLSTFFIGNRSFMDRRSFARMEEFGLGSYRTVFEKSSVWVEDLYSFYREKPLEVEKVGLFFRDRQAGLRVQERISRLPVSLAASVSGNLEITGRDVNKGSGLKLLCGLLEVPLSRTIAVGDGANDRQLLQTAGFAVAMENAAQALRMTADVVVPDCDHDGAAIAMERYMLR